MQQDLEKNAIEYIDGIARAAERYDAFLVDVWGVLHDSARVYPGTVECLGKLQALNKRVVLLSNAARRAYVLEKEFAAFGITRELYDQIISSGELTWSRFKAGNDPALLKLGRKYYLLGSEKYGLTDELPLVQAADLGSADFLLTIGVIGNPSSTEAEEPLLREAASRKLTMICANPDIQVVRDGVMGIAAGAVAARYEELGGKVIYYGKPHAEVYQRCFEVLRDIDKDRIVAVGDALITDIAGANANGLDSVLVASGIHAEELKGIPDDTEGLETICMREQQRPTMVAKGFFWLERIPYGQ